MTADAERAATAGRIARQSIAWKPILLAAAALVVVLSVFSNRYGFNRDELYFRMLRPAWGYEDQSPLTPLLVRTMRHIADQPWAVRLPATAMAALSVVIVVLITRELGGGRRAQALSAWSYAFAGVPLTFGHVLLTSTAGIVVWPAIILLAMRALLRAEPAWWLGVGAVAGLSTYDKFLVVTLLLALGAGVLISGPRRVLLTWWIPAAAGLALVIALPNVLYQATHGWPELDMGRALRAHNAGDVRTQMWPLLVVLLGPPLVPFWLAGLVGLGRRAAWRPVRGLRAAFAVLLVLVFLMGSQSYYTAGMLAALLGVGCVPVSEWLGVAAARRRITYGFVALNAAFGATIALPLVPLRSLGSTPIPAINTAVADTVGWPRYVAEIRSVADSLAPADRRRAVVLASNYGEAGAVARYGTGLPPVFSAQNALYDQARPPADRSVAVVVGGQAADARRDFRVCRDAGRLDNGVDVDNEEQGEPILVCRGPRGGWARLWPRLRHLD